ncbi:hypothetical protein FB451DRAFT_1176033 [Mycena latifolia]|nr:hypothetical protein FB451DRAFT_1176033 [Mycena latifolia]
MPKPFSREPDGAGLRVIWWLEKVFGNERCRRPKPDTPRQHALPPRSALVSASASLGSVSLSTGQPHSPLTPDHHLRVLRIVRGRLPVGESVWRQGTYYAGPSLDRIAFWYPPSMAAAASSLKSSFALAHQSVAAVFLFYFSFSAHVVWIFVVVNSWTRLIASCSLAVGSRLSPKFEPFTKYDMRPLKLEMRRWSARVFIVEHLPLTHAPTACTLEQRRGYLECD